MQFDFVTSGQIVFGPGTIVRVPGLVRDWGRRALVVTGRNPDRATTLLAGLRNENIEFFTFSVNGEPTLDIVRQGVREARRGMDFVIGFGGGSAMDTAKAVAALVQNSGEPLDYLEIIGKGNPLEHAPLPVMAIPTTAGTGAEVTRNAVLGSPEHGMKASLRSPLMIPNIAVVDSDLTVNLPASVTASTGLDALTQLIEPYVSSRANSFTDALCREGLGHASRSLHVVFRNGQDHAAREWMSFASLLSGIALTNAGLGVVHGFAGPLGGMLSAPHGALCAAVLPHGMAANIGALRERAPKDLALARYGEIARILTGDARATPEDGVSWVTELCGEFGIASLGTYGLTQSQIPDLVERASKASSMKGNPIALTASELSEVAQGAMGF